MATARDIIKSSLKLIGVVAAGETPSAEELVDALSTLRKMLDSWSTESLAIFKKTIETFPLVSGQTSYTMGASGNFNTSRPMRIIHAATLDTSSTPAQEIPLQLLNVDEWSNVMQKSLTSTYATKLYIDYTFPLTTLYFWPVPTLANSIVLYTEKPFVDPATPDANIDLPPGYELAIEHNLAILLSPGYGRPLDPTVAAIASTSLANIQRMNIKPMYMTCDPAIVSRGHTWDWRTGE